MKKVSISVNTLNKMKFGVNIFYTAKEAQEYLNDCGECGEGAQIAEAYEMGGINKRIEYNVFRGYVINW